MSKRYEKEQKVSQIPWGVIGASILLICLVLFLAFYNIFTIPRIIIDRNQLGPENKDGGAQAAQPAPQVDFSDSQLEKDIKIEQEKVGLLEKDSKLIDTTLADVQTQNNGKEITRRIDGLTSLSQRVNGMTIVSQDQKKILTTQIQTEITSLQALEKKMRTDLGALAEQENKKQLTSSYAVYGLFMPKMQEFVHADKLVDAANSEKVISDKIQIRINQAKPKGKDPSVIQADLQARNTKIQNAIVTIQNAINIINQLAPQGFPENKQSLIQAKEMLSEAKGNIQAASALLPQLFQELKVIEK